MAIAGAVQFLPPRPDEQDAGPIHSRPRILPPPRSFAVTANVTPYWWHLPMDRRREKAIVALMSGEGPARGIASVTFDWRSVTVILRPRVDESAEDVDRQVTAIRELLEQTPPTDHEARLWENARSMSAQAIPAA